ncbi:MAG TPA: MerR family transcriptional regulator [Stellaceae bacterium]|nr:MerR family transcriptional regulator [Stellaceae bacterium]
MSMPSDLFDPPPTSTVPERTLRRQPKSAEAFRTISEVAQELEVPQHVLRFWESRFPQVRPLKRAGGRRYYRPDDVVLLRRIRQCLYDQGYTIKGVQKLLREGALRNDAPPPRPPAPAPAARPKDTGAASTGRAALVELRRELAELRDLLKKRGG